MTGKNSSSVPEPELLDGVIDTLKCHKHTRLLERLPELVYRRGSLFQKNPSWTGVAPGTLLDLERSKSLSCL
ncbi:hypothetical protein F2Q70_00015106 [Brassica cretica]|uniref:Uncharacterized protein n=1 Tax=Brassica cretica TaxID=69181 RepID=A0A8S9HR86_BRACR|nr:hypothetical protein F2Q70_00015106 [Brassica cretica]